MPVYSSYDKHEILSYFSSESEVVSLQAVVI